MANDGSLIFNTKIDTKGFSAGTKTIQNSIGSLKSGLLKLGSAVGVAFGVKELISFSSQAIETASDLQEVQNVVDTAFGDMSGKMEEFADKAIETYGISKLAAKQTGSNYMAMATGMNVAKEEASDMALTLTGLSADMASFYNVEQSVASTALKSIFTGETETLKQFGVVMTETNLQEHARQQGITKTIKQMTQAEKVQLRYNYVMAQTSLAQGDFARTSTGWANQTRILSEQWKEFKGTIGTALMTGLLPVINAINKAMSVLIEYATKASEALMTLFGVENKAENAEKSVAKSTTITADNYSDIEESAKETADSNDASLASFDEINKIAEDTNANTSESISFSPNTVETVTPTSKSDSKSFDTSKFENAIARIKEKLQPIVDKLTELWQKLQPIISILEIGLGFIYFNILVPLGNWTIEDVLPRFLETVSIALDGLKTILDEGYQLFVDFYNNFLKPISEYAGNKFTDFLDKFNTKLEKLTKLISESEIWKDLKTVLNAVYKVLQPILKYLIDLREWFADFQMSTAFIELEYMFKNLEDAIGLVAAVINLDFSDAWNHLKDMLVDNKVDKATEKFDLFKNKIVELKDIVTTYFGEIKNIMTDVFDKVGEKISTWWEEDVSPWFTIEKWNTLLQNMVDSFAEKWNAVYDFFMVSIPNWWDETIAPWFTLEKWEELFTDAKEGVSKGWDTVVEFFTTSLPNWWDEHIAPWFTVEKWKELGSGIKDGLVEAFSVAVNGVIDVLNWLGKKLNKFSLDIPEIKGITDGFHLGFDFDEIEHWTPKLATGTVVPANYGEFLAVLGDNKRETEVVSPLSTIEQAVRNVMGSGAPSGDITIPVYIGTEKIDTIIISAQQRMRLAGGGY